MSTLHARLLAAIDEYATSMVEDDYPAPAPLAALRAVVVELHAPVPCNYGNCLNPGHRVCKACGSGINAEDCSTIRVIADALGVKDEELIEKESPTNG